MFEIGRVYHRRRDIHGPYGGSWQSGIAPSGDWPLVFLFTGQGGAKYGYDDERTENGVFLYTGEGQEGHMSFTRGNRAIRNHAINGRDLHLFEKGKGGDYIYLGHFACSSWEYRSGPDRNGDERRIIVFHLIPLGGATKPRKGLTGPMHRFRVRQSWRTSERVLSSPPQQPWRVPR